MSIKLVICDIGNTIYKEEKSNKFDKIQQITHGDFAEIVNNFYRIFNKSDDNLFDLTNKYLQSLNINNEKIFSELYEYFKTLKNRSTPAQLTNENIFEVAKFIKSKNIKLILSSNSNILTKKNDDKLLPFVDGIERTYKIGFLKDEPEYYDYIQNKYNVKPNEILCIGDDVSKDFEIPKRFGWKTYLYDSSYPISKMIKEISDLL